MALVTAWLEERCGIVDDFGRWTPPEASDPQARLGRLQPWHDVANPHRSHAHDLHIRYYYVALRQRGHDRAAGTVQECLRFAAAVGAPLVQMLPSGETRRSPIATREMGWRPSVEGMRTAAREAERLGIRIAIEPLNRYEAYLVTTVSSALAYLEDVGAPAVGMTLDLFHANTEERAIGDATGAAGSRLWHRHAADTNRLGLGRGHLNVPGSPERCGTSAMRAPPSWR